MTLKKKVTVEIRLRHSIYIRSVINKKKTESVDKLLSLIELINYTLIHLLYAQL